MIFANLAAVFRSLGHSVEYLTDHIHTGGDLYVFCPSLITLHLEQAAVIRLLARRPDARVLVAGPIATAMPEVFADLDVTVVKGEAEQLLWKLDDVLARPTAAVQLGIIEDLDRLPLPDWSGFSPWKFKLGRDFWKFPTALVQHGRGCPLDCDYCPQTVCDNTLRFRDPEAVVDEIDHGVKRWGFRSFRFVDPMFGLNRTHVFSLADRIGRLPYKIQFSVETRIDLMPAEILRVLKRAGLSSLSVGIETPDEETLQSHGRVAEDADRQLEFINRCRRMGIRTTAGFMIGFPHDTEDSIRAVLDRARLLGPTFADFRLVTPYPGTRFSRRIGARIGDFRFSRYTSHAPVIECEQISGRDLQRLQARCYAKYYLRRRYLLQNAALLWPGLRLVSLGRRRAKKSSGDPAHDGPPRPMSGSEILMQKKGLRKDGAHSRPGVVDTDRNP
jgi:radical SAM superfamily enzyme YgiQ (UPF0313 family)